jgi:hypothetical protein
LRPRELELPVIVTLELDTARLLEENETALPDPESPGMDKFVFPATVTAPIAIWTPFWRTTVVLALKTSLPLVSSTLTGELPLLRIVMPTESLKEAAALDNTMLPPERGERSTT